MAGNDYTNYGAMAALSGVGGAAGILAAQQEQINRILGKDVTGVGLKALGVQRATIIDSMLETMKVAGVVHPAPSTISSVISSYGMPRSMSDTFFESLLPKLSAAGIVSSTTPGVSRFAEQLFSPAVIAQTADMLRSGEILYEDAVDGISVRDDVEQAATVVVGAVAADLPREHQMELHQVAAFLYTIFILFIVVGFGEDYPVESTIAVLSVSGEALKVGQNFLPSRTATVPSDAE